MINFLMWAKYYLRIFFLKNLQRSIIELNYLLFSIKYTWIKNCWLQPHNTYTYIGEDLVV